MAIPAPQPGLVISYAYLWWRQSKQGLEEGSKDRPCAIVLTAEDTAGETVVTVAPITHSSPADPEVAVEIPSPTKARLGLDAERSWVVVDETNTFVWPGPDLRPIDRGRPGGFAYGFLPPKLFRRVRDRLVAVHKARRHRSVRRTD